MRGTKRLWLLGLGWAAAALAGCEGSPEHAPFDARTFPPPPIGDASGDASAPTDAADGGDAADATFDTPALDAIGEAAACVADPPLSVATAAFAHGAIVGPDLSANICEGGTYAYVETAATVPYLMVVNGGFRPGDWRFDAPADAKYAGVVSYFGVNALPGTYSSAEGACGVLSLCITFPIPASLDCGSANAIQGCPAGCALQGPASKPICTPIEPHKCYVARSASSCLASQTPRGSWSLTLDSLGPFIHLEGGGPTEGRFTPHGSLTATLERDGPDAGAETATLGLVF